MNNNKRLLWPWNRWLNRQTWYGTGNSTTPLVPSPGGSTRNLNSPPSNTWHAPLPTEQIFEPQATKYAETKWFISHGKIPVLYLPDDNTAGQSTMNPPTCSRSWRARFHSPLFIAHIIAPSKLLLWALDSRVVMLGCLQDGCS